MVYPPDLTSLALACQRLQPPSLCFLGGPLEQVRRSRLLRGAVRIDGNPGPAPFSSSSL